MGTGNIQEKMMNKADEQKRVILHHIKDWSNEKIASKLVRVTFLPGSYDKRFARAIQAKLLDSKPLTEKQENYLRQLIAKYRNQITFK